MLFKYTSCFFGNKTQYAFDNTETLYAKGNYDYLEIYTDKHLFTIVILFTYKGFLKNNVIKKKSNIYQIKFLTS